MYNIIRFFIVAAMSHTQKLNSIKLFINIFNIEFYGFSLYFNTIFHTVSLQYIIQDDVFNTINLIIDYGLAWDLLIVDVLFS